MGDRAGASRRRTVLAAGTVGGAGTTVALRAALEGLATEGGEVVVIAPRSLASVVASTVPHATLIPVGRVRAILGEMIARPRATTYIGFADRLPIVGRGGDRQVLVVQNPHLYETTELAATFAARAKVAVLVWWARRSAARADRIVCSSASSAAAVAEASGVELGRIEVRPIPVASVDAVKVDHRERIERVLLVGDVYGYKRWEHAIEAAAAFAVRAERPLLVIHIGTGRDAAALTRLDRAIEAGASSGVTVERRGVLAHTEVLAAMTEADVVMLTSTAETQGLPLAEALSVGLPVVCRDLDVFVEQGGDAAVFVAGGATEFAAALADLDDRAERVRRSELGRELMAQRRADGPGWRLID